MRMTLTSDVAEILQTTPRNVQKHAKKLGIGKPIGEWITAPLLFTDEEIKLIASHMRKQ